MKEILVCPSCEELLEPGSTECQSCGWMDDIVYPGGECPWCGENKPDSLDLDSHTELVRCLTCGREYDLNKKLRSEVMVTIRNYDGDVWHGDIERAYTLEDQVLERRMIRGGLYQEIVAIQMWTYDVTNTARHPLCCMWARVLA